MPKTNSKNRPALLELRPTQFSLGMKEVESKLKKFAKFNKKQQRDYCADHVIPIVWGWDNQAYMIDHHHFVRACWEAGVDDYEVHVLADFRHLSEKQFWKKMVKRGWTYLHDQFGNGPHRPQALPIDVRCLGDDPYRSLAWHAVDAGAIEKSDVPFFEFQWAEFLRKNLKCALHSRSDFKDAIEQTLNLARSKKARRLPGYIATGERILI